MPKDTKVTPIHATIRQDQDAMLKHHAETGGYISVSQALRVILDEWKRDREQERQQAQPIA